MKDLQWFIDRIGQVVSRTEPEGRTTLFDIDSEDDAKYAHSLQDHKYTFEEAVVEDSPNVCLACE